MNRIAKFILVALMIGCTAAQADNGKSGIGDLYEEERYQWKHLDIRMSAQGYRGFAQHNQRVLRATARSFLVGTLKSLGVPETGIKLSGAAIGLAASGAKIDLNQSNTLSLELDDMVTQDRSLFLKMKLDW